MNLGQTQSEHSRPSAQSSFRSGRVLLLENNTHTVRAGENSRHAKIAEVPLQGESSQHSQTCCATFELNRRHDVSDFKANKVGGAIFSLDLTCRPIDQCRHFRSQIPYPPAERYGTSLEVSVGVSMDVLLKNGMYLQGDGSVGPT